MAIEPDRFVSPVEDSGDVNFDRALRPTQLSEYWSVCGERADEHLY